MTDPHWVAPGSGGSRPQASPAGTPTPPPPSYGAPPPPSYGAPPPPSYGAQPPPASAAPYAGLEFRPGVIPLRPLTLGDLYGATIKAVRGNVGATMGLAFITTLVFLVPTTALGAWVASFETTDFESEAVPVTGTIGQYIPTIGTYLSAILLTGFVAHVVGQAVQGRKTTAGRTWELTRGRVPQLVAATVITSLAMLMALALVVAGPVLLIVAAVDEGLGGSDLVAPILLLVLAVLLGVLLLLWVSTRLAFLPATIVLERSGIAAGIRRSWALTSGRPFWRVLGIRLLTALIVGTVAQVIAFPLAMIGVVALLATSDPQDLFMGQAVITGVAGLVTGALTTPFTAGVDALLYVDQRIRREGFDVALMAAAQQPHRGSGVPARP